MLKRIPVRLLIQYKPPASIRTNALDPRLVLETRLVETRLLLKHRHLNAMYGVRDLKHETHLCFILSKQ